MRVPGGIIVGVMEEVEPDTCVQPCFVGSRLGGSGSRACSQMANCAGGFALRSQ